jgi:hypothetical protein
MPETVQVMLSSITALLAPEFAKISKVLTTADRMVAPEPATEMIVAGPAWYVSQLTGPHVERLSSGPVSNWVLKLSVALVKVPDEFTVTAASLWSSETPV